MKFGRRFFHAFSAKGGLRVRRRNAREGEIELERRGKARGEPIPLGEICFFREAGASKRHDPLYEGSADYSCYYYYYYYYYY